MSHLNVDGLIWAYSGIKPPTRAGIGKRNLRSNQVRKPGGQFKSKVKGQAMSRSSGVSNKSEV